MAAILFAGMLMSGLWAPQRAVQSVKKTPASLANSTALVDRTIASLPLSFEVNQGLTDPHVKFLSHANGFTLLASATDAVLIHRNRVPNSAGSETMPLAPLSRPTASVVQLQWLGANTEAQASGMEREDKGGLFYFGRRTSHSQGRRRTQTKEVAKNHWEFDLIRCRGR